MAISEPLADPFPPPLLAGKIIPHSTQTGVTGPQQGGPPQTQGGTNQARLHQFWVGLAALGCRGEQISLLRHKRSLTPHTHSPSQEPCACIAWLGEPLGCVGTPWVESGNTKPSRAWPQGCFLQWSLHHPGTSVSSSPPRPEGGIAGLPLQPRGRSTHLGTSPSPRKGAQTILKEPKILPPEISSAAPQRPGCKTGCMVCFASDMQCGFFYTGWGTPFSAQSCWFPIPAAALCNSEAASQDSARGAREGPALQQHSRLRPCCLPGSGDACPTCTLWGSRCFPSRVSHCGPSCPQSSSPHRPSRCLRSPAFPPGDGSLSSLT